MAACRCSTCGIDYPGDEGIFAGPCSTCIVCGEPTSRFAYEPFDPDWDQKVKSLLEDRKDAERTAELIPVVKANVRVENGQLWVLSWDVFKVVRRRLCEGDLFRIGQQTFEVVGYVDERREYVVRPFSMTLSEEDLSRLAGP